MAAVAFYISGHGFGHASRQIEIINALAARRPDLHIFIRSSALRRLFDRTVAAPFEIDDRPCDTGVVQIDSLRLDAAATIVRADEFHRTIDARARTDAVALRDRDVRLVVADAPPLGCAAAARAGIPSVVVSNFTWDWIYAEYAEYLAAAPRLIPTIQAAYRLADAAWRLPMHGGFEAFTTIVEVPWVARHARPDRTRHNVLCDLTLPMDRPLALVSFGGYGVRDLPLDRLDCLEAWTIVLTGIGNEHSEEGRVRVVGEHELYEAGLHYEDLVAACDAVITKPGYGIVSECIANETAIVYTSRGRFAEYPVLVRDMPRVLRCACLDSASLFAGRWRAALDAAVSALPPPEQPATDGADVIAGMIASFVGNLSRPAANHQDHQGR